MRSPTYIPCDSLPLHITTICVPEPSLLLISSAAPIAWVRSRMMPNPRQSDETVLLEEEDKTSTSSRKSLLAQQIEWLKSLDEPESEYYMKQHPVLERLLELPIIKSLL